MPDLTTALHSVSVSAVIVEDGRVLVIRRRDTDKWEPPGGVLELHETIVDALHREIAEETGLEIAVGSLTGVYKNMPRHVVALVFRCTVVRGSPMTNDEVSAFRWLAPSEVRRELDEAYAIRIMDALDQPQPAIRAHDGVALLPARRRSSTRR